MNFAIYETSLGFFRIEYTNDNIVTFLKKVDVTNDDYGVKNTFTNSVINEILEYFEGNRKEFTFKYELNGTPFQKLVWSNLCKIPYGETSSYKELAIMVGNPKASRAVGMANNKNPITIIVPCHRVIGSNGDLVGYAGGLKMKEFLLNMEKANYDK